MERQKFEDSFKDAFQDAQLSPSESVWTNIDLDLERAEGGKMKRRILFYKLLAAASVVFAMSVAGVGYYALQHQSGTATDQIALEKDQPQSSINAERTVNKDSNSVSNPVRESTSALYASEDKPSNSNTLSTASEEFISPENLSSASNLTDKTSSTPDGNKLSTTSVIQPKRITESELASTELSSNPAGTFNKVFNPTSVADINGTSGSIRKLPSLIKPENSMVMNTPAEPDPVMILMAKLNQREKELAGKEVKKQKDTERLWTSVGVAAGGFSNVNSSASSSVSAFNTVADQQLKASGVAYSVGVNVGTRLSNRWVLQGGVNYQTQSSDYTASAVVGSSDLQDFSAASINDYDKFSNTQLKEENKLLSTVPYSVNNSLQFVSVPMQAGYLVINKKIGLQVNAGISTDLFLQNTITPEGGSLGKSTQGRGDDSPYRSVNFSGLVGTELTYKLGTHYRLALNPGLRYPINSIYKSDTGVSATPLTVDVGLRFRYIF